MRNNTISVLAEDYVRMARAKGLQPLADHVDVRGPERDPAQPDGLRDVARLRRRRRDPRRVRLQLPGRRLDVPAVGREPGLRADAGAVPADHRRRAARRSSPPTARRRSSIRGRGTRCERVSVGVADRSAPPVGPAPAVAELARPRRRPLARGQPQPEGARRGSSCSSSSRARDLPRADRAVRPDRRRSSPRRSAPSRAHLFGTTALRPGHLLAARSGGRASRS